MVFAVVLTSTAAATSISSPVTLCVTSVLWSNPGDSDVADPSFNQWLRSEVLIRDCESGALIRAWRARALIRGYGSGTLIRGYESGA